MKFLFFSLLFSLNAQAIQCSQFVQENMVPPVLVKVKFLDMRVFGGLHLWEILEKGELQRRTLSKVPAHGMSGDPNSVYFSAIQFGKNVVIQNPTFFLSRKLLERGDYFVNDGRWFYGSYDPYDMSMGYRISYSARDLRKGPGKDLRRAAEIMFYEPVPLAEYGHLLVVPLSQKDSFLGEMSSRGLELGDLPVRVEFKEEISFENLVDAPAPKREIRMKPEWSLPHKLVREDIVAAISSAQGMIDRISMSISEGKFGNTEKLLNSILIGRLQSEILGSKEHSHAIIELAIKANYSSFPKLVSYFESGEHLGHAELRRAVLDYLNLPRNGSFLVQSDQVGKTPDQVVLLRYVSLDELFASNLYNAI